jgi:hypothetical protein
MKPKHGVGKSAKAPPSARRISVPALRRAIQKLPAGKPLKRPGVWYLTQREHWLGWSKEYDTQGAYDRIPGLNRDARYAYNHIVCPPMLLWLASAAGVKAGRVRAAKREAATLERMPAQAGAIRRHVPWELVAEALWPEKTGSRK